MTERVAPLSRTTLGGEAQWLRCSCTANTEKELSELDGKATRKARLQHTLRLLLLAGLPPQRAALVPPPTTLPDRPTLCFATIEPYFCKPTIHRIIMLSRLTQYHGGRNPCDWHHSPRAVHARGCRKRGSAIACGPPCQHPRRGAASHSNHLDGRGTVVDIFGMMLDAWLFFLFAYSSGRNMKGCYNQGIKNCMKHLRSNISPYHSYSLLSAVVCEI